MAPRGLNGDSRAIVGQTENEEMVDLETIRSVLGGIDRALENFAIAFDKVFVVGSKDRHD